MTVHWSLHRKRVRKYFYAVCEIDDKYQQQTVIVKHTKVKIEMLDVTTT